MKAFDWDFFRKPVVWLLKTAVKTTRLIQKAFQTKVQSSILLDPLTAVQNGHQHQSTTVKWKRLFLIILRLKMKRTIQSLWKMTTLVQTAGSLIFSICNLFDLFNLQCCIRSLCFETSKTFFTLGNINFSGPLFWEVKKYTMLATNSRPHGC